jgi:hypothetical protein
MHRFSEFAEEEGPLAGDKVRIEDLLGRDIEILAYRLGPSRYPDKSESGKYLQLQFRFSDEDALRCMFTGSGVLIRQLEKYHDKIPFLASIERRGRCFTFV